jgi:hypothetical protein
VITQIVETTPITSFNTGNIVKVIPPNEFSNVDLTDAIFALEELPESYSDFYQHLTSKNIF